MFLDNDYNFFLEALDEDEYKHHRTIKASVTKFKAFEILKQAYFCVTMETVNAMIAHGELSCFRYGTVDRVPLTDVQRVLRSWQEQEREHVSHLR